MARKNLCVRIPGKIILSGEHSVVFGYPALVVAVNKFITLTISWDSSSLDNKFFIQLLKKFNNQDVIDVVNQINAHKNGHSTLKMESEIPLGCGMGASAALASGLSLLVLILAEKSHSLKEVNKYAFLLERQAHSNPSGVDNTIVTHGGILRYQKQKNRPVFSKVGDSKILRNLFLVNTGKPIETTAQMVNHVKRLFLEKPALVDKYMKSISESTKKIINSLSTNDKQAFITALKENQRILEKLEVVSPKTRTFIQEIEKRGGVAKISGAGGQKNNSGMVLVYSANNELIETYIKNSGYDFSLLDIDGGIVYEIK